MAWHNPALSKWKRGPDGGAVGGLRDFLSISLSGGNRARRELSLPLATSIHAGPCPLSSPLKNLKNHSSEREILQNVKQKVLSRIEVSVATKISNSCHWPGIINRFPFVFWSIETLSFMIIGVASLFKAHLLVQRRQAHVWFIMGQLCFELNESSKENEF